MVRKDARNAANIVEACTRLAQDGWNAANIAEAYARLVQDGRNAANIAKASARLARDGRNAANIAEACACLDPHDAMASVRVESNLGPSTQTSKFLSQQAPGPVRHRGHDTALTTFAP